MEQAERTRMIEELTEDHMYNINYMEAMNMLFNLFAMEFEALEDEQLKARYLSRFSNNQEVH
jgi:hypothetical protein|tara:strand:- start:1185 stop:1370 length:186 start_codon:yes stop_codon:yes gene_type:complete